VVPLVMEKLTMRLLALRWVVASILTQEGIQSAHTAGNFYQLLDGSWSEIVASHSTLRELVDGQSEVTLRLVIP